MMTIKYDIYVDFKNIDRYIYIILQSNIIYYNMIGYDMIWYNIV